jgi:TetR/AcrR family transcriptional regulator, ethionamide resistance regulator
VAPIKGRRSEQPTERRTAVERALFAATAGLLTEGRSYTELSVEQIASRAGISRPAFYFYFQDKRELLMRLVEGISELLYEQADQWWSAVEPDRQDELRRTLAGILEIYRAHAPLLTALVEAAGYDVEIASFWRQLTERFVEATRAHLEAEQAAARARAAPPYPAAWTLVWMTERAWYQHVTQPSLTDDELIDALSDVIWTSIYGGARE